MPRPAPVSTFAPDATFWRGRRVFLTGHTGFKGSWLTLWLHALGANVTGYALPCGTRPSMFRSLRLDQLCRHREGDVRDPALLRRHLRSARPEIILHLAAQPLVRRSYLQPAETFATNVQGTVNLLEACRGLDGLRAVVVVTTDKCYENRERNRSYRESDPLGGRDPYSASKACAELVVAAYRQSYFNPAEIDRHGVAVATARAGNVFAGGDWSTDRLIPDLARAFRRGEPARLRNPAAVRPWQFVTESLAGYLMLARACHQQGAGFASAWNFGPAARQVLSVEQVAQRFAQAWPGARCSLAPETDAPHEARLLLLDSTLARRQLGWRPRLAFDQAITATAEWYQEYYAGGRCTALRELTRRQLATDAPSLPLTA